MHLVLVIQSGGLCTFFLCCINLSLLVNLKKKLFVSSVRLPFSGLILFGFDEMVSINEVSRSLDFLRFPRHLEIRSLHLVRLLLSLRLWGNTGACLVTILKWYWKFETLRH